MSATAFVAAAASLLLLLPPADSATNCCSPNQMTGSIEQFNSFGNGEMEYKVQIDFAVDFDEKLLAMNMTALDAPFGDALDSRIVIRGQARHTYTVNSTGMCSIRISQHQLLPTTHLQRCTPYYMHEVNSTSSDERKFGAALGGMNMTVTVTADQCLPIENTMEGDFSVTNMQYTDLTLGIKDPSVFDIPAECRSD